MKSMSLNPMGMYRVNPSVVGRLSKNVLIITHCPNNGTDNTVKFWPPFANLKHLFEHVICMGRKIGFKDISYDCLWQFMTFHPWTFLGWVGQNIACIKRPS